MSFAIVVTTIFTVGFWFGVVSQWFNAKRKGKR